MDTLIEIKERFHQESKAIISQIKFFEDSIILPALRKKNNDYVDVINTLPTDLSTIQQQLNDIITNLESKLLELKSLLNDLEYKNISSEFYNIDLRTPEGECIELILDIIREGEHDKQKIAESMQPDLEAACIISQGTYDEDFYSELFYNKDSLMKYIDACLMIFHNQQIDEVKDSVQTIEYYLNLFNLIDTSKTNNIYRQAFIQIITLFDTIVFDLIKTIFRADFFGQLKFFKDGSIKFSEMARYQDIESFETSIIESILKNCYLKDLLKIIKQQDENIYLIDAENKYPFIREIINRRNCHIHNNGKVDVQYMEEFNIYSYNLGDFLVIDKQYFDTTCELCEVIISKLINFFILPDSEPATRT